MRSLPTNSSSATEFPSRVVSLPCWELFDQQPEEYRDEVLPPGITTACVAVEQASTLEPTSPEPHGLDVR